MIPSAYKEMTLSGQRRIISKEKITGSESLVRCLLQEGVDTIFGYPGGAIMPVYDSLYHFEDEINHILTRHEQGAVHAAQGYARVSGKVGVCMATSGPGATNLITGIADAQIDSTPLVCITGQVSAHLLGTDAFQETDVIAISTAVTKWNIQVTTAKDIPAAIAKAFYIARSGRPGPVVVDVTKNAQVELASFEYQKCLEVKSYTPDPVIDIDQIDNAAEAIKNAKRPLIIFGHGVIISGAKDEFQTFVEKSGIPAACTIMGLSGLNTDHPLHMGMLGMHGNYGPNVLTNECDVLIAIGMRFDDRVTGDTKRYATQAKVIHLEIDASEIDKIIKADFPVLGDCRTSLKLLTERVNAGNYDAWINQFEHCRKIEYDKVIAKEISPDSEVLSMAEVVNKISELSNGEAVLVTDVGQHQMIAQRYYNFKNWRSNITSGGLGTMGFCLPAAMGAKVACPERQVIAVMGDGGFQMTLQEMGTLFQSQINIKILILNNEFLGMVRQWQQLFFDKRYASTTMINPDFQTIAKGYGVSAQKIEKRENLEQAIKTFLNDTNSSLLEVMVGKEDNVFPMIPSGASLSEIKLEP